MDADVSKVQINQISPIAAALTGGNTVIITGSGFQKGAIAYFGSQSAGEIKIESDTQIAAVVPGTETAGSVAVTIVNPDGTQFTKIGGFTYISPVNSDKAEVIGISPLTIIEEVETEITIRGRNLIEAYEKGFVALRCPSRLNLTISKVVSKDDKSDIDSLTFSVYVSASTPLQPNERIAIQVLASRRAESRNDLIVESSKQMFVVLPRHIPVPLAYTPSLSKDKPTMFVILGRNLEGCTMEFGNGVQTHLQKSDERSLYGIITVSEEKAADLEKSPVQILDKNGNPAGQYDLFVATSSDLKQTDPLPSEDEFRFKGEGSVRTIDDTPTALFNSDLVAVPDQMYLGPTAEDASVYDLRGELATDMTFDSFGFEIIIFSYYLTLPIINEVYLFAAFDGGGSELGSDITAKVGELFAVRGSGILFAARLHITLHITVRVIIWIDIPWLYGGFNEFPEEFPNAIGTVVFGVIISIDIIIVASLLWALVRPDGSLRILLLIGLTINIDFTISSDGLHLNFVPNYRHSVRFYSILPFADSLPCGGRFQLAADNGQTSFSDGYGGHQSFYFARSAGECCIPWNFNLELVRFRTGQGEQVEQPPFQAYMCVNAQFSPNLNNIIITSVPPPQGIPPTLTMNIADSALLKALTQTVDEVGNPTGAWQDLRDLGYDVDFFLALPAALLDPSTLPDGNAFAIQAGLNIIRASIALRRTNGQTPLAFWSGAVLGFDIIRYLAQGEAPRIIAGALPLDVNANPGAIKVEPVLAYEEVQPNGVRVLREVTKITTPIPADLWEVERYEPFETTQREFILAVKVEVPPTAPLPATLDFKVNVPVLKNFLDGESALTQGILPGFGRFGADHYSSNPTSFFTGNMVAGTASAPVTASVTISDPPPSPTTLIKVGNIKIKPNTKEEAATGSTPKKLVPPGKNVLINRQQTNPRGTNFVLTVPITCVPGSGTTAVVSFLKPELNLVVRNDETCEEYLRVFKETQAITASAPGTYFAGFANALYTALSTGGTPVQDILKTQGEALWTKACELVAPPTSHVDDRVLYWTRLQGIGAIRAYAKRTPNSGIDGNMLNRFEWASRGLDAADGSVKFTGAPLGARRIIVTGFDPFALIGGADSDPVYSGKDYSEQSNPSGLIALSLDKQPIAVPNLGMVYVRTAVFPVRYKDFNASMVENAITPSLGSIIMLITTSQNGLAKFYDVERWAGRKRAALGRDNNEELGIDFPTDPSGENFLESTLPFGQVIITAEEIDAPIGTAPLVIDQSYKTIASTKSRGIRRRTPSAPPPIDPNDATHFRPEPLLNDDAGHQTVPDRPSTAESSEEGSGGNFLSNEIFYRSALKRKNTRENLASGHVHVPPTFYNPTGTGGRLIAAFKGVVVRFCKHGFHLTGPASLDFPPTVINSSSDKTLTVQNTSTETLKINTIDIAAPFSVAFPSPSPLPITVTPGGFAAIPVRFTPTSTGSHTGSMTLRELSGEILLIVSLSGAGVQQQPTPVITSFTPHVVPWGEPVTVTGQYFTTTTMVKIGNMMVDYTVASDNQIIINTDAFAGRLTEEYSIEDESAVPPNGTGWITGYIKITTVFGTVTSSSTIRIVFAY